MKNLEKNIESINEAIDSVKKALSLLERDDDFDMVYDCEMALDLLLATKRNMLQESLLPLVWTEDQTIFINQVFSIIDSSIKSRDACLDIILLELGVKRNAQR